VSTLAAYKWTHRPGRLAWFEGRRPLGVVLHSSNEPGELSQWLCHDDSNINIGIIIISNLINSKTFNHSQNFFFKSINIHSNSINIKIVCKVYKFCVCNIKLQSIF